MEDDPLEATGVPRFHEPAERLHAAAQGLTISTARALGASAYASDVRAYELTATGRAHQVVTLTIDAAGAPPIVGG